MTAPHAEPSHQTKGLVRLTMVCNERCPFCNVPAEDHPVTPTPVDALAAQLDAFVAAGQRTLTVSGGEPTLLRKRLLALIADARARGIDFVELQTNAILIDAGYARALVEAGLTSAFVSLLSHVPEHHDALAGLKGAFPRCLAGLDALLAADVAVTLNPVTAARTQALLPDYVDFVAARLPGVEAISVSAVQPHGRAAANLDLLPDYGVLGEAVREARRRAEAHGIRLLNPYCGLPLCVGWDDAPDRCVEAVEAQDPAAPIGLDNAGNKAHGPPCRACALRTRCGGAWHAYWHHRSGAGIAAPLPRVEPWAGPGRAEAQVAVDARGTPLPDLRAETAPTRWLLRDRLSSSEVPALLACGATDLALWWQPADRETLRALRRALRAQAARLPQRRLRAAVAVDASGLDAEATWTLVQLLHAVGVDAVRLRGGPAGLGALAARVPGLEVSDLPMVGP
ncbi:MAG: radical SAM protein [Alphaproteobacteria bacterium]|nr:radical SAM protein [Alphaproteobacteria bacterium]